MDLVIAISQGLGLAAAAGLLAAAPLALGRDRGHPGLAGVAARLRRRRRHGGRRLGAGRRSSSWPTRCGPARRPGLRLGRRIVAGGLAFELGAGGDVPYVGPGVGAVVAGRGRPGDARACASGAVKAGGDVRGTAIVEDGAGLAAAAVAVIPFVGLPADARRRLAAAAPAPARRREVPRPARVAMTDPGSAGARRRS